MIASRSRTVSRPYPCALVVLLTLTLSACRAQRLNEVQVLGTHNSYHLRTTPRIPEWDYAHPPLTEQATNYNVRAFELDVHAYDSNLNDFPVLHVEAFDTNSSCATLGLCSGELASWSNANPGHSPLFIYIDNKVDYDTATWSTLDLLIEESWGDKVLTPAELRGNFSSLNEAVIQNGSWPTMAELQDRVVFFYKGEGYNGSVIFRSFGFDTPTDHPDAVFLELGGDPRQFDPEEVRRRIEMGFILRARADDPDSFRVPSPTDDEILRWSFDTVDRSPRDGLASIDEVANLAVALGSPLDNSTRDLLQTVISLCTTEEPADQLPFEGLACFQDFTCLAEECFPVRAESWRSVEDVRAQQAAVLSMGVHIVVTDHEVPNGVYSLSIFDEPLRCNPVTSTCPDCNGNPCQNGGTCDEGTAGDGIYTCACVGNYRGENCEIGPDCFINPCRNGGLCQDSGSPTDGEYDCSCALGYSGDVCEIAPANDSAPPTVGENRGVSVSASWALSIAALATTQAFLQLC